MTTSRLLILIFFFTSFNLYALDWKPGPLGDLAFQTSDFMKSGAYANPNQLSKDFSESGAYDINRNWDQTHQGKWYIEEQRYGFDAMAAGIANQRQDLVQRALTIYNWGFKQERANGAFPCPDEFHSTSFFLEAVARSGLLLQVSTLGAANQTWIDAIKPKIHLAATWMTRPENELPGKLHNEAYTHRFYLVGLALGEAGIFTQDPALVEHSKAYIRAGIRRQDPSGFNPELGGYDVSYHAFGMFLAISYYTLVADDELRAEMKPMIDRGIAWLKSRSRSDGTFDLGGDTRVGGPKGERMRNGKLKTMSYWSAYRALYYWGMITHDQGLIDLAIKVENASHLEKE